MAVRGLTELGMRLRNAPSITLSGPIERVGVGWCTDGAGYPLRFAAYVVDRCLVNAREALCEWSS